MGELELDGGRVPIIRDSFFIVDNGIVASLLCVEIECSLMGKKAGARKTASVDENSIGGRLNKESMMGVSFFSLEVAK